MPAQETDLQKLICHEDFPLSSQYDPEWVLANEMGPNVLWLTEALGHVMKLKPPMRVLDLGCGTAMSSIFLAREYGVQVWATDLWVKPTSNWKRIQEAHLEDKVFPIHAEARSLPYADEFFDAIVSLDSYHYFGTDVHYLEFHLLRLLKRGGRIGIVSPASAQEIPHPLPEHLDNEWYWMNSVDWWREHWQRYPELDVELAEPLAGGWEMWVRWHEVLQASGRAQRPHESEDELRQLRADAGRYLGFVRMVARRK
jgi:ubiquinone/menaquinone biosynthesis C-methylase UbiE